MLLENKKVLVTGAGGFVGSHLVERLVEKGNLVRCFVRYNSRNDSGLLQGLSCFGSDGMEVFCGDLKNPDSVRKAVESVDVVFHLGALISIPYSYVDPAEVVETNVLGTLNVMQACRDHKVKKVIHTSTSEVYGTARYVPMDESHPLQAQSPYSASKIGADKIVESYMDTYDLPAVIIRPFNAYGPRQSARAVIPTIITQALTLDYVRLGNVETIRDYTFVGDLADAFIKAAESEEALGKLMNIGANKEISIGDLARKIVELTGRGSKIMMDEKRLRPARSEVMRLKADNTVAKGILGWQPQVSLDRGLALTVDWVSKHLDRYQIGGYVI